MRTFLAVCLALCGTLVACGSSSAVAPLPSGGLRVLFIGNSLTYVNDLPRTLSDLAASAGDTIRVATVAYPDFALVDHVREGSAVAAIRRQGSDYVVLQQGPSSTQINRDSLILLSTQLAPIIRASGARPALYSVWPQLPNYSTFPRAIESYRLAAAAVNGVYLPVGAAWQQALAQNPSLPLYANDGLHADRLGTYLAALVMYERLTGKDARRLSGIAVVDGAVVPTTEAMIRMLQQTAHDAVQATYGVQ